MIEKKLKKRTLKEDPALIIAAFGSSKRGKVVYELCDIVLKQELGQYKISWAFTSEIIREKSAQPGVLEALSSLEAEGYRKVVIQPLHIFPATEYSVLSDICYSFPGMRVIMGETLLHRWDFVNEVLEIVSKDFIPPEDGINIVAAHGTPLCSDSANTIYLSLDHLFTHTYDNVFLTTIEGIPNSRSLFKRLKDIKESKRKTARIIPFMYVAGLHVEKDLLDSDESYKSKLENMGFSVNWLSVNHNGQDYPKGLGFYKEIPYFFVNRIKRALQLIKFY